MYTSVLRCNETVCDCRVEVSGGGCAVRFCLVSEAADHE